MLIFLTKRQPYSSAAKQVFQEQRIAVQDLAGPHESREPKKNGAVVKSPLEETGNLKYSDFSLAELRQSPLTELLLKEGESFLSPAEVAKTIQHDFPFKMHGTSLPVGVVVCVQ